MVPQYLNLITSDSDLESQSQNFVQDIQIHKMQLIGPTEDSYEKFISSNTFILTNPLKLIELQIIKFIQNQSKNVMFIFGPSGCGKKCLLMNLLRNAQIAYQIMQEFENQNQNWERLENIITKVMQRTDRCDQIYIFNDFPMSTQSWNLAQIRKFKRGLPQKIKKCKQKIIFVLNSQIYNYFYILNQASLFQSIDRLNNVSLIKMSGYGKRQMKQILKECCQRQPKSQFQKFLYDKNVFDQISQLAGGDARKALNLLYWKKIQQKSQILNKKRSAYQTKNQSGIKFYNQKSFNKNNQRSFNKKGQNNEIQIEFNTKPNFQIPPITRISLFHALGKLLYGKRLNVKNNLNKKKQISCYYNEQQILTLDPPFYFDPIQLFQKTHSPLPIFASLLQQNYLNRFGKISDVVSMNKVFLLYHSLFSNENIYQNQDVTTIRIILVTWGMLICNKNSRTDFKTLQRIQRSKCNSLTVKLKEKKQMLKQYYSQFYYKDLYTWAHLVKRKLQRQRQNPMLKNLYDIIFTNRKNTLVVEQNIQSIKQQEEDDECENNVIEALKIKQSLNQIIKSKQKRDKQLEQLFIDQEMMSDFEEDE